MKFSGIRQQTILVALVPILVMTLLFGSYSIYSRFSDADQALLERSRLVAHHLAAGSEFGLFTGNTAVLRPEIRMARTQQDVVTAIVLDRNGHVLAVEGENADSYAGLLQKVNAKAPLYADDERLILYEAVETVRMSLDESDEAGIPAPSAAMGAVVLEISKQRLKRQKLQMLAYNLLAMLLVTIVAMVIALWFSHRIANPILSIALIIHKIGEGHLNARIPAQPGVRELDNLATDINKMARQLTLARDTLEQRIQQATYDLREKKAEAEQAHEQARQLNHQLSAALNELETIIEANPDILYVFDTQGRLIKWNSNFAQFFGLSPEQLQQASLQRFFSPDELQAVTAWQDQILNQGSATMEARCPRHDGVLVPYLCNGVVLRNISGEITGFTGTGRDITERHEAAERMRHMAHFDALTDLPNRALFADRLQQAMANAHRHQAKMALMFIDLDLFKQINDSLGHHIGDLLLQEAARRMQRCVRASDTIARLGGDEFVALISDIEGAEDALKVAENIRQALRQPFLLETHDVSISSSIGIALYPEHAASEDALINHADTAMYLAKEKGRNTVVMYAPSA